MSDVILSTHNLTKIYSGKPPVTAVGGINISLRESEILGLLGPNGSGKTTTIQMLLGTLSSTSGSIVYFGKDFALHRSEILQNVSFASTYTSLPWLLTIEENLEVFGCLYGFSRKESAKKFDPLLERFGIYDKRKARVSALSAGQITRLMLVKAFFTVPRIVLLDEPTASLDPEIANDICSFILEQRDKTGLSVLFTSHKMNEVMEVCDRAIFLKKGKVIADDIPEKLAKSVSSFKLCLVIVEGLEKAVEIANSSGFEHSIDHRLMEVSMDEDQIAPFIKAITQSAVTFTNIKIEEPSLEDFFLQMAKK